MDDKLKQKLNSQLHGGFDLLTQLQPDTKEYEQTVDAMTKLHKLHAEEAKMELEANTAKSQKRERWAKVAVDVGGIVLPLVFYGTWLSTGMKFEQTGTFTSTTLKGLIGKFKPTRK